MTNKPVIRTDVEYHTWQWELQHFKNNMEHARILALADPQRAKVHAEESAKDLRRFVWYCIGEVYPL